MSPHHYKRYSKSKVRHQRKELDERKKRISGLTLVQDMGKSSKEPDRKQTRAMTGFTKAVREFGERRSLFETEAYASVVSKVKPRPKITKGRLTVPNQGLFARGKISKPAFRGRPTRARDCELHEIIRQAQNNPRGQEYQLQKQRQRDHSPEVDDPDPVPSADQSTESLDGLSPACDYRFSPDYTSTKRQKEHHSFTCNVRTEKTEAATSTIVRDISPQSIADRTMSPSMKDMLSSSAKEALSPGSREEEASVLEMEREENIVDGMTKWIVQLRETLKFNELGYLQEARKYLQNLHKETLHQELEKAAITQMAIASKTTMQTPIKVLPNAPEQNAHLRQHGVEISLSKYTSLTRTNQIELQIPRLSNQNDRQGNEKTEFENPNPAQLCHSQLEARQISHQASHSYEPQEENPVSNSDKNNICQLESPETSDKRNDKAVEFSYSTDESFNFSPNVSVIDEVSNDKKDAKKRNSSRLREGRERVDDFETEAAEERQRRLQQNREREYREKYTVYRERLRSGDRFRSRSFNRLEQHVDGTPGRKSKSLERNYSPVWDQRSMNINSVKLRVQSRESTRKIGEENKDWYTKDEMRREGQSRRWENDSLRYRQPGRTFEDRNYQPYHLRSSVGPPDWLLEKTPERVFRPQKMFN